MKRDESLEKFVEGFNQAKVLVIGDLMLDEFIWGEVTRISPEAPVPVVWVQSESVMPGGAANVANNMRALGADVFVAGIVGEDRLGSALLEELTLRNIDTTAILRVNRPTTVKTRVIAHHQQVVRVDRELQEPLAESVIRKLLRLIAPVMERMDAVVVEDYGKGVVTRSLLSRVIPLARRLEKIVTVDPKEEHFDLYRGVTALTPNRAEAGGAVGRALHSHTEVQRAGEELIKRLDCEGLLITLGEDGMCLFERNGRQTFIPTVAQEVFDVAGAGDTVIGAFTLALASGAPMVQAARMANQAAGIVVGKLGVAVVSPKELRAQLVAQARSPQGPRRAPPPRQMHLMPKKHAAKT